LLKQKISLAGGEKTVFLLAKVSTAGFCSVSSFCKNAGWGLK